MRFPNHFKCTFLGTSPRFTNFTQLFKGVNSSTLEAGRSRGQVASSLGGNNNNSTTDLCLISASETCRTIPG